MAPRHVMYPCQDSHVKTCPSLFFNTLHPGGHQDSPYPTQQQQKQYSDPIQLTDTSDTTTHIPAHQIFYSNTIDPEMFAA